MNKGSKLPFCRWCRKNRVKRGDQIFCSPQCYSDSGHRRAVGKVNGPKWAERYWKRFALKFEELHGHRDRMDQIRILIGIGMRRAYKQKHKAHAS